MNVEDLRDWLQERLDKQDVERQALAKELSALGREVGEVKAAVSSNGVACDKKHESLSRKIAIRDKYMAVGIIGVVGAACKLVWDAVTPKGS